MAATEQRPASSGLVERAKNILLKPKEEWDRIDTEPATINGLYLGYVCVLAAIGPLAQLIGGQLFGYNAWFVSFKPPLVASVVGAVVRYLLSLGGVFVLALVIDALATTFGGTKNRIQAFKIAVYSSTAAWIAAIFGLLPPLAILSIVGLYSLYLLYLGLPKLMKAPQDKALGYTAVTVVAYFIIFVIIAAVSSAIARGGMGATGGLANTAAPAGQASIGGAKVDLGKLDAAAKQMQAAAQAPADGKGTVQAVPIDTLKSMLPAGLAAGYARTELSGESGGAGGLQGSSAEGVYNKGDSRITLKITDVAAAGALASLAGAMNVQSERQTATGYQKVHMDGGHMVSEEWDNQSKNGKYSVMVGSRFFVEAEGEGADMSDLKGAVGSVPLDRLVSVAKG
jgi:hypothetical protein